MSDTLTNGEGSKSGGADGPELDARQGWMYPSFAATRGSAWRGFAWLAWQGLARHGGARQARQGMA